MRTNNNINNNLKKRLFESPNPPRYKREYNELKEFIFPSMDLFIAFLDEENFEQQTFLAEKILLRLSYDSFFSPPTRLLFNVLSMETLISGEKKQGFIGRDHFVHIVHSYLLGVYMFLYHQIFNENIMSLFKKKRSIVAINSNHLNRSTFKDFIVSLRYFVMYHDISYPIEYMLGNENIDDEVKELFLKAFTNIPKSIGKDLSLRSLSKFIAVYKLVRHDSEFSFKTQIILHIEEEQDKALIKDKENYCQIEKVYGYETFRTVYSIFEKSNICSVLYEKRSNLPYLIFIPKEGNNVEIVKTKHYSENITLKKLIQNPLAPYDKDHFNLKNYEWGFFINPELTLKKLVEEIFPNLSFDEFDKTIEYIHDLTSSHLSMVISDSSFKQYCFDIYMVIYKLVGYLNLDDKSKVQDKYFSHLSDIISDLGKEIPTKIGNILASLLNEKSDNIDFENDMEDEKNMDSIVLKYLKYISKTYKGLAQKIASPLKSEIQTQYELKKNLDKIRDAISEYFDTNKIEPSYIPDIKNNSINHTKLTSKTNGVVFTIIKYFKQKSKKVELDSFEDILKYKPDYFKDRKKFFDHGVNSGLIFLSILDIYENLMNIDSDDKLRKLLKVAIGIDIEYEKNYIEYKSEDIFSETFFAIIVHNLYPKYLLKKEYRTKLENNPFTYFAILMDSLQHWDRKYQVNQGFNELPYNTLSRGFNIEIKNNRIRISEFDARLDMQKRLTILKNGINEYLEKASDFIELNLAEY